MLAGALLFALVAGETNPPVADTASAPPAAAAATPAPAPAPVSAPAPATASSPSSAPAAGASPSLIEKPQTITPGETTEVKGGPAPTIDPRLQGRAALPDSLQDTPLSPPGPPQKPPPEKAPASSGAEGSSGSGK